jgi:2-keto-4-pentenoate hydratase/2-oxohepta-3-ene-1,7-dioic acid hydratase in catechol pathway
MRNIVFFGKNYVDHMNELGDKPVDKPVIFLKPENVLRSCQQWGNTIDLYFPESEMQYETELVFKLKSGGFQMTREQALASLEYYTVGLDMTKRALQKQLKENGHPWTIGKVFPDAAVIGPWKKINNVDASLSESFSFLLNDQLKQKSAGKNMIFAPADLIVYASQYFPFSAGDIIFTGTPSGVGNIAYDDVGTVMLDDDFYRVKWSKRAVD